MTNDIKPFKIDLDGEDKELLSNIEFKLDDTTTQLLKIKEQLEILNSLDLEDNQKKTLKNEMIFGNVEYFLAIKKLKIANLHEFISCSYYELNKRYDNAETLLSANSVAEVFQFATRLSGFLKGIFIDKPEMFEQVENFSWVIQEKESAETLIEYIEDDCSCAPYEEVAALLRCRSNLLGLMISFIESEEFEKKFFNAKELYQPEK